MTTTPEAVRHPFVTGRDRASGLRDLVLVCALLLLVAIALLAGRGRPGAPAARGAGGAAPAAASAPVDDDRPLLLPDR